jgi:hypothetical protein
VKAHAQTQAADAGALSNIRTCTSASTGTNARKGTGGSTCTNTSSRRGRSSNTHIKASVDCSAVQPETYHRPPDSRVDQTKRHRSFELRRRSSQVKCSASELVGGHDHQAHTDGHDHQAHTDGHDHQAHTDGHDHQAHTDGQDHTYRKQVERF